MKTNFKVSALRADNLEIFGLCKVVNRAIKSKEPNLLNWFKEIGLNKSEISIPYLHFGYGLNSEKFFNHFKTGERKEPKTRFCMRFVFDGCELAKEKEKTGIVFNYSDWNKPEILEAPKAEAPKAEAPKAKAPKAKAPKAKAPKAKAPKAKAPKAEAPKAKAPKAKAPKAETLQKSSKIPEANESLKAEAPKAKINKYQRHAQKVG